MGDFGESHFYMYIFFFKYLHEYAVENMIRIALEIYCNVLY